MYVTNSSAQDNYISSLNNEDLMINYSLGDADAFEELYQRNKGPLYRFFMRQLHQSSLAEEFAHEVWLRVIKARQSYLPKAKFTTYLFQIAHNHLVDHFRKTSQVREVSIDENEEEMQTSATVGNPEITVDREKQKEILLSQIRKLPSEQREVFLLKEEANLTLEEIAQVVNENVETIKSRMRYAIKKLKQGMQQQLTNEK